MIERTLFKAVYRPLLRRATRQILQGRAFDQDRPEGGRWLSGDVATYRAELWREVDRILASHPIDHIPTLGNRHNVFLAAVTTAGYRVLRRHGVPSHRAMELIGDVGWKVYAWMLQAAALPWRITTTDRQRRMDRTLRALMRFPFRPGSAPAYEAQWWSDTDGFHTHWTHCPPHTFVRRIAGTGEDDDEIEAFRRSWCLYDWAAADVLAGGHGDYRRPHTLSRGDDVCDMCWRARPETAATR